jgi:predicted dehydrogenase
MPSVRVGVIGAGAIAPAHCLGVLKHPKAELVGVADASKERARLLQKEFAIPRLYTRVDDLLLDPDVDAVSIALPTCLHAATAIMALEAGKHVMLDKPFAMNREEAKAVIDAARKSKRVFTVGMNQRFARDSQVIRTLVERGDLGEVYHAKAYWNRRSGAPRFGTWFCEKKKSGGGSLLDIGVHMLDLCLALVGNFKPLSVSGSVYTRFGNRGLGEGGWGKSDVGRKVFDVDDLAAAFIKLKGGVSVVLETSWARHQAEHSRNNVELFGTDAGASVYPARLYRFGRKKGEYDVVEPQGVQIRHRDCDRMVNWIGAILGHEELECTPEQSLAVQKIIDAIYESATTGREVKIR